jgi:iron complex outermembrane receptor protein
MSKLKLSALHLAIGSTLLSGLAFNVSAADESVEEVERIEVTGSRIKRTDVEGASPVISVTAADMAKFGFHNVQDVLENLPAVTGALTTQSIHGFTPAASSINLRNAGSNRTLTLVNGKRLVAYPKASGGTNTFQNTGNLPTEAVKRIDILTAGGSAIYGADAVGGVVNVILKDDYEGFAVKARTTGYTEGGGQTSRFAVSAGSTNDKMNVSVFLEYEDSEVIKATDRENFGIHTDKVAHTERSAFSSYGARIAGPNSYTLPESDCTERGFFWDSGNERCGFDRTKYRDLKPATTKGIALATMNYELNDEHKAFGRFQYSRSTSKRSIEPMGSNDIGVEINGDVATVYLDTYEQDFNKETLWGGQFSGADYVDGDYTVIRRFHEFGPRGNETTGTDHTLSLGLEGELFEDTFYELAWTWSNATVDVLSKTYATKSGMFEFITNGENGRHPFESFSADDVNQVSYVPYENNKSSQNNFAFNISGNVMELEAGSFDYSAGIEHTSQTYATESDTESAKNAILTTGGSSGSGKRDFFSVYSEVRADVLEGVVVSAALRYDDYSDFGDNLTPQISVEYRPMEELLLRATYSDVFRAPDMQRVYGDPSNGFDTVVDYKKCAELGGSPGVPLPGFTECDEHHISTVTGGNKELKAETGYSVNYGAVYSGEAFDATVDLWEWKLDDMVSTVASDTVAQEYNTYSDQIVRDANGSITFINSAAQNLAFQKVSGIDFDTGYRFELNELGDLRVGLKGTYLLKSDSQLNPTEDVTDDLNDYGLLPKLKMNLSLAWSVADYQVSLFGRYTDRVGGDNYNGLKDSTTNTVNGGDIHVASHTTWNLSVKYDATENFDLLVGSSNIFNKGPNYDPTDSGWPHYPRSLYNATGRSVYLEAQYKF